MLSHHLGRADILTDEAGDVVAGSAATYYPFGGYRERSATNPTTTEFGFTGHRHNDSVGLVYANARFYLPGIGRFISADSIVSDYTNPQSLHRYSYVRR